MGAGGEGPLRLRVVLEPEQGTDPEDGERLGRQLRDEPRDELRELDVDDVVPVGTAAPPVGRKSGSAATLPEWLVTMSAGGGVFVTVVATVKEWLARRAGAHKVTLTIDGDTLELSTTTPTERAELIETFLRRHQPE